MEKPILTSASLSSLQAKLSVTATQLQITQAREVADDVLGWLARNFEFTVQDIEKLRSMDDEFRHILGWHLAAALLSRQPIIVEAIIAERMLDNRGIPDGCSITNTFRYPFETDDKPALELIISLPIG